MTEKQHNIFFLTVLFSCVLLIVVLSPPTRNYIPIIWALLGFGLHLFWFSNTWRKLSRKLIDEHKTDLESLKISFHDKPYRKAVDIFTLFRERKKIESLSDDIKTRLSYFRTYFRLMLIAFLMFGVLGALTVLMA